MFVDESGNPRVREAGARDDGIYIQSGLIVRADEVHRARAAVDKAKREMFRGKDPMNWELHGYDVWRGTGQFRNDLPPLDNREKLAVFTRTVGAIEESGAVLVSVIIWKNRMPSERHNLLRLAWRLITDRFGQYLADRGGGEAGQIIADASSRGTEAKIRDVVREMSERMSLYRHRPVLVLGDVRFVDSASEPLVQAADMAAYIMHKHCRKDALIGGCFDALVPCMWQRGGEIRGFGITHRPD